MPGRRLSLLALLALGAHAFRATPARGRLRMAVEQTVQAPGVQGGSGLPGVRHIIAVSSCKGGVGKSTTAVNLAFSLHEQGYKTGILDADVFGPSLPTMVRPKDGQNVVQLQGSDFLPLEAFGVKLMSLGYVREGVSIMRGPMVMQLIQQLLEHTAWGYLDYLVVDFPPGTGDVQLTMTQALNITAAVIVTTPQRLSFVDVVKGIDMFDTVGVPCVAVVENMAYYEVPDLEAMSKDLLAKVRAAAEKPDVDVASMKAALEGQVEERLLKRPLFRRKRLFGEGHKKRLADMWGIENTISLPLLDELAVSGDSGTPYMIDHPDSLHASAFRTLASGVSEAIEDMAAAGGGLPVVEYDEEKNMMRVGEVNLTPVELRAQCRCAVCVEELTGKPLLDPASIAENIKPATIGAVGRYAFGVDWSDGHKSLFPYRWITNV